MKLGKIAKEAGPQRKTERGHCSVSSWVRSHLAQYYVDPSNNNTAFFKVSPFRGVVGNVYLTSPTPYIGIVNSILNCINCKQYL